MGMSGQLIGTLIALVVGLIVWFAFVVPSERRYHERKLRLLQERIERRQQNDEADDESGNDSADRPGA